MALHFLTDDARAAQIGGLVVLTGGEAHHAAAVRRVRPGEAVTLGDGLGVWLEGVIGEVSPHRVTVQVTVRREVATARPRLILAQALAKGDRDERAIQAATELGIDEIVPWQAARSVSRWDGTKAVKAVARWQSIVREAAKQAHRAWVPQVASPHGTRELAARADARILVLEPAASAALTGIDLDAADVRDIVLVVGPEGGISPEELDLFAAAGARTARLGETVLRTSTAGPAALAVLSARLGRW